MVLEEMKGDLNVRPRGSGPGWGARPLLVWDSWEAGHLQSRGL